jgi:hypothetical protein
VSGPFGEKPAEPAAPVEPDEPAEPAEPDAQPAEPAEPAEPDAQPAEPSLAERAKALRDRANVGGVVSELAALVHELAAALESSHTEPPAPTG